MKNSYVKTRFKILECVPFGIRMFNYIGNPPSPFPPPYFEVSSPFEQASSCFGVSCEAVW